MKSEKSFSIALTLSSYKSWSLPVRAKPCENQSFTKSLIEKLFSDFIIYTMSCACNTTYVISSPYMHAWHEVQGGAKNLQISQSKLRTPAIFSWGAIASDRDKIAGVPI